MRGWLKVLMEIEDVKKIARLLALEQDYLLLSLGRFKDQGLPNEKQRIVTDLHNINREIMKCDIKRKELRLEYENSKSMLSSSK